MFEIYYLKNTSNENPVQSEINQVKEQLINFQI